MGMAHLATITINFCPKVGKYILYKSHGSVMGNKLVDFGRFPDGLKRLLHIRLLDSLCNINNRCAEKSHLEFPEE